MSVYLNLGGNSSVVAYVIQPDAIDVQFRNGRWYRYSYRSAGANNVETMKSLAIQGKRTWFVHSTTCEVQLRIVFHHGIRKRGFIEPSFNVSLYIYRVTPQLMSRIKRQHIVPRLYLKYFTPDGKRTYVYIKKLNKYKFVSIKDICVKEDFYTIKHKGVCHNFIETYLSDHIEPLLGKCIESIINYVNTQSCQLDLPNICRSLICQYYRGTDFRIEANNIARIRTSIFQSLFSTPLNPDIIEKTDATLEHASDTFCNTPFIKDRINLMLNIVTGQLWFPINTNS